MGCAPLLESFGGDLRTLLLGFGRVGALAGIPARSLDRRGGAHGLHPGEESVAFVEFGIRRGGLIERNGG